MTTHEYAKKLLSDVDCDLNAKVCRVCDKRIIGELIGMAAMHVGQSNYSFHPECYNSLSDIAKKEAADIASKHFKW